MNAMICEWFLAPAGSLAEVLAWGRLSDFDRLSIVLGLGMRCGYVPHGFGIREVAAC